MKDSKNLVIGMLCAVVCIMAVAYAAFTTSLEINGTATITSNWKVAFGVTMPECTETPKAPATTGVEASVNREGDTLATVSMSFTQPGDTATCEIPVVNSGSLNAVLNFNTTGTTKTELVEFTIENVTANTKLAKGATHNVKVTGTFLEKEDEDGNSVAVTDDNKTAELSIILSAEQDLGA